MKPSFLNTNTPFITEMIQSRTAARAERKIRNAIADGATAIGLQVSFLPSGEITETTLRSLFAAAEGKPIYLTNYRQDRNTGRCDEELLNELLFALDCGGTLLDVMGDAFEPSPEELTRNEKAIAKQMKFIDEVHKKGGEVLMSSHITQLRGGKKVFEFLEAERVLEIALEHQRRGADIVKIVTGANTEEEQIKNLDICRLLKQELSVPFLFLSGGTHTYLHRTIGPALGSCMWLCFREYDDESYAGPPLLSNVIKIKQALKL